tara:strand:- start:1055 stop:1630 length:576 start_codon:yes stop_codon:yes gene_type:complete
MKKIFILLIFFLASFTNANSEIKRIVSGDLNARITIIAYESLTCSHCADFHKKIYPELKKDYIDKGLVKIEFRHFPLDLAALNAAKIAQCQENQSLEILETLYSNQQAWIKGGTIEEVNTSLEKFLKDEGFSLNFNKCVDNKKIEDFVINDRIEGTKNFEINATPTIIINNKKFEKSLNYKNLKKSLEKLI